MLIQKVLYNVLLLNKI